MSSDPLTEADVQHLKDVLTDPTLGTIIMAVNLVFNAIFLIGGIKVGVKWVAQRPWWDNRAKPLQAAMLMNFGYKEEECTDKATLDWYALGIMACIHHGACGLAAVPIIVSGGRSGHLLFCIGCICDVGLDIVDFFRMAFACCFHQAMDMAPTPPQIFILMGVCHHMLAICLVMPLLLNYMTLPEFHYIVCALLLAAACAYSTGAYKFTLDTNQRSGFIQYKAIVVFQLVTIYISRGLVWFWCLVRVLRTFADDGANTFWWGGVVLGGFMSFFNFLMIMDATLAAIKWLPRSMPQSEEEQQELRKAMSASTFDMPSATSKSGRSPSLREVTMSSPVAAPLEVGEVRA